MTQTFVDPMNQFAPRAEEATPAAWSQPDRPGPRLRSEDRSTTDPTWRPARPTALTAECACPGFCERDHANE
jgi:hypothetical protein